MVPEVFYTVTHGGKDVSPEVAERYTFTPAILHGFCRRRVEDNDYPGITEDKDHQVFGTYVTGLTDHNLDKLDMFEGSQYERKEVKVKLLTEVGNAKGEGNVEGEERLANVYVWRCAEGLEDREWDLEEFRKEKMTKWTREGYVFSG